MSLEQAILDRLEKRNAQIAQLQSTVQALERAADSQREHAMIERGLLLDENKKLAAQIESDEKVSQSNREHAQYQIASLTAEVVKLRAEVPLESTREGLKNAVAKLQEETKRADKNQVKADALDSIREFAETCGMMSDETVKGFIERKRVELEEVRLDFKGEESQVDTLERRHAEDMKAQAELMSKYESLLAKTTDLGSYAMTLGRKEGEPLEMFMERQALRVAAYETKIELRPIENRIGHFAVICTKCDELAKAMARIAPLELLYKTLKGWQENDHIIGYGLTIDTAINKATEALSQLTA